MCIGPGFATITDVWSNSVMDFGVEVNRLYGEGHKPSLTSHKTPRCLRGLVLRMLVFLGQQLLKEWSRLLNVKNINPLVGEVYLYMTFIVGSYLPENTRCPLQTSID
jgi:hypothetical protein